MMIVGCVTHVVHAACAMQSRNMLTTTPQDHHLLALRTPVSHPARPSARLPPCRSLCTQSPCSP